MALKVKSNDTVIRITNPNGKPGEVDGLVGDRQQGYGWSLAERGDYIYIGTWFNTIGAVVTIINAGLKAKGLNISQETVEAMMDVISNNEIPHPSKGLGGQIYKMHKDKPGEFTKIFETDVSFRNVILFGDDLYFTTYRGVNMDKVNHIYKVDLDDNVTSVYETTDGACSRACAILDGKLYFAGADSKFELDPGDEDNVKLAVMVKDDEDDRKWDYVADYHDFIEYASDGHVKSPAGSPFWDMVAFKGSLYVTLPGSAGFIAFEGHPAKRGEKGKANQYGWVWTEIVGRNAVNYPGICETPAGNTLDYGKGIVSVVGAFGVFNDSLYCYNIDNTITSEIMGISGMLSITQPDFKLSNFVGPVHDTIKHAQKIWKYNETTGRFDECVGFTKLVEDTCVEYVWKSAVYNGEFYIGTMDSKVIYNYLTRLTNGNLLHMGLAGWKAQLGACGRLVKSLANKETLEVVKGLKAAKANAPAAPKRKFSEKFDKEGLKMYWKVSETVRKDPGGFHLLKTSDGEHWEHVTDCGFGDLYNYGCLRFAPTDHGLYMTTANPFYGTQLYLLKNNKG
ncbi:MAG: hypothetical protein J5847_05450 [Clostridia bacterium]|nr:hypothetical protein [Clostridia bacterium]